ncbi:MAG: MopE-related protein [Pseudomonadota bacterium]
MSTSAKTGLWFAILLAAVGCDDPLRLDGDGDGYCELDPCEDGSDPGDCDDADAEIHPGATEACNGIDDDCDGALPTDEADDDNDGFMICRDDCDDSDASVHPGASEICDGVDDDCDGDADEENATGCVIYYLDEDDDGYGAVASHACLCGASDPYDALVAGDCDEADAAVSPAAAEACDGLDNDCDGDTDEAGATGCSDYYRDEDDDSYGVIWDVACLCAASDPYDTTSYGDCDDAVPEAHLGAVEICDGLDNDCDGGVDEGFDLDGDGYSSCAGDCDDHDATILPGAAEVCDGVDQDCDGDIDEGVLSTFYADADADGFGDPASTTEACAAPSGFVADATDCDDADPTVFPGAEEACNGVDDDCDPTTDELTDADGDAYSAICDGDCDDSDPSVFPGADEIWCDGVDSDCDGAAELLVPTDHATIQDAIDTSSDGDVVCVAAGTYSETITFDGRDITVEGLDGSAATIIDGGGDGPVVTFDDGETADAVLRGFTLTNGYAEDGGGLYAVYADPTLEDLVLTGNESTGHGGGGYLYFCDSVISDLEVSSNTAAGSGGGLYVRNSTATPERLVVTQNSVTDGNGGGLYLRDANIVIDGATIDENTALNNWGGGMYAGYSEPEISDATFNDNLADYSAGVYFSQGYGAFTDVEIDGNIATQDYGGLYLAYSHPTLTNVSVSENEAYVREAGVTMTASSPSLYNVAVSGNHAPSYAGLMLWSGSCPDIEHLTVSENQADNYVGMVTANSDPTISNAVFLDNTVNNDDGGAMFLNGSSPILDHVLVAGNHAGASGGGIYVYWSTAHPVITNSLIVGNTAGAGAGAVCLAWDAQLTMTNVAVVGNVAGTAAGAFYLGNGDFSSFTNVIVYDNVAGVEAGGFSVGGVAPAISYSDVWGNSPDDFDGIPDPTGTNGNVSVEPIFLDYDPTADPYDWDLHLASTSPLVDQGDPSLADPDGGASDMGAYGGEGAEYWDLDNDGFFEWWLPGAYDPTTSPGMDPDDRDASVVP